MSDGLEPETGPRRIVVALDPADPNLTTLQAAAEIAARMRAELVGVFVEDIDLLRVAGLPFAREFTPYGSGGRGLDTRAMERTLRAQATALRRALAAAAERRHLQWSFRVSRGRVAYEVLSASEDADLVVVGRSRQPAGRARRVGSTARTVVGRSTRTVIVLHVTADVGRPVLVVYDDTPSAERALITAAAIADEDHKHVVIAVVEPTDAAQAVTTLQALGVRPRVTTLAHADVAHVLGAIDRERCRTLVVGAGSTVLEGTSPADLIERSRCPVVLVR